MGVRLNTEDEHLAEVARVWLGVQLVNADVKNTQLFLSLLFHL